MSNKSILLDSDIRDIETFLFEELKKIPDINAQVIWNIALDVIRHFRLKKEIQRTDAQAVENTWYQSLASGNPDYGVYDSDYYLADLWSCWVIYSRNYLKTLRSQGILKSLGNFDQVIDVGCGFGLTTAALKELYPDAEVTGTNLPNIRQTRVAENIGQKFHFKIMSELPGTKDHKRTLIFASEYFEHFYEPVAHLREIINTTNPDTLIIANSFGARAIGHFNIYKVDGSIIPSHIIGRKFNDCLRSRGYEKMITKLWNNRPAIWVKVGSLNNG